MATERIVLVALIFVALTAVPVAARSASSRQEINAYDVKGAPELHAEEGKDDVGASAAKEAHAIMSNPVSKAHVDAAEKYIKEAQMADSPEKAAVAKKAAAQEMASALAYASQDAATKEHVVAPTDGDATERKEASTISGVRANTYTAGEKGVAWKSTNDMKGAPEIFHAERIGEDAAAKAHAIMSNPIAKAHVDAAEKYIKEAQVADSPEKAAAAKKAAAQEIASALAYASQAAAVKEAVSAPTDGDATERKEANTISGVRANTYTAGEKDDGWKSTNDMKAAPEVLHAERIGEDAAAKAHAIMSNPIAKAHVDAAEKYIKEAQVADSPEKAAAAKKAAAQEIASALAYASQAAAAKEAVSAPTDGDATERKEASTISGVRANTYTAGEKDVAWKSTNDMKGAPEVLHAERIGEDAAAKAHAIMSNPIAKAHVDAAEKYIKEAQVADSPEKAAAAKKAAAQEIASALAYASQGATAIAPTTADSTGGGKSIEQAAPLTTKDDAGYKA